LWGAEGELVEVIEVLAPEVLPIAMSSSMLLYQVISEEFLRLLWASSVQESDMAAEANR